MYTLWHFSLSWFVVATLLKTSIAVSKNSKRGLCFAAGDTPGDIINANQSDSVVSWQYNWDSLQPAYLATSNIKYIPMQWGSSGIQDFAERVKMQGADTILAFNEPDFADESNIQPQEAAELWMQYIQPLKSQGVRLGGPAITATGKPWLTTFFAACRDCSVDFIALHWYGSGSEGFYNYLWDIHSQWPGYPIWITEFAETSNNDTVVAEFLDQTTTYLDTLDWIEKYAWFGYLRSKPDVHYNLLSDDGGLNNLGEIYTGAKTIHTQVVSAGPTTTYRTVNGADQPSQAAATTRAPLSSSASRASQLPMTVLLLWSGLVFVLAFGFRSSDYTRMLPMLA